MWNYILLNEHEKPWNQRSGKKFWVVEFWVVDSSLQGCDTVLLGKCLLSSQRIYGAFMFRATQSKKTLCSLLDLACEGTIILWNYVTIHPTAQCHIPEYLTLTAASFWGTPDLPVSSYRTLIYVRGFPAIDFNLSMSVLQYYIYYQIVEIWPYFLRVIISYFPCLVIHVHTLQE